MCLKLNRFKNSSCALVRALSVLLPHTVNCFKPHATWPNSGRKCESGPNKQRDMPIQRVHKCHDNAFCIDLVPTKPLRSFISLIPSEPVPLKPIISPAHNGVLQPSYPDVMGKGHGTRAGFRWRVEGRRSEPTFIDGKLRHCSIFRLPHLFNAFQRPLV